VTDSTGLRRVLELVGPSIRVANTTGSFTPSSFATPLAVAAYVIESPFVVAVTATSTEAEQLRDALAALLGDGDEVALWPAWDTHPLERVSPDEQTMAIRALLRWRLAHGTRPRVLVASARSIAQLLPPEPATAPITVRRGTELARDAFIGALASFGYHRESLVEHRAEFAVRGGIVDVWPAQGTGLLR
jgi:transcription-repair coupling factor (superfamily II helicase)